MMITRQWHRDVPLRRTARRSLPPAVSEAYLRQERARARQFQLILYTDGVWDAKLAQQERLGERRFTELLSRTAPASAEEWIDRLEHALEDCMERPDDVTAVAIRRERCVFHSRVSLRDSSWSTPRSHRQPS